MYILHSTAVVLFVISSLVSSAQDTLSKGAFILHKFQQPIGREFYSMVKHHDSLKLRSDFKFTDRGQDVFLDAVMVADMKHTPGYFKIKGSTSRFSTIDAEVTVQNESAAIRSNGKSNQVAVKSPYYTIGGYSPVAVQMEMIRYWKQSGKPPELPIYPSGKVRITFSGRDTLIVRDSTYLFDRYFVRGLIWGSEIIWTDTSGKLVALITNDAEGDKFEAVDEPFMSALPDFLKKAAIYGMASFQVADHQEKKKTIVLKNAKIIDVVHGIAIPDGVVVIESGKITKAGDSRKVRIPKGAKIIDVAGKSVLPGLWDMHSHFQQVEWGPAYLAAGVTTIRDCGNEFDFINAIKSAIDNGKGIGPRIIKAGIIDGDGPSALGIVRVNNASQARAAVNRYKEAGYEQIKIYSSVKSEMIKAIADEAHRVGLSVTGHVPRGVRPSQAILAGMDQVNHFHFLAMEMMKSREQTTIDFKDSTSTAFFALLKVRNIVADPTLGVYEWAFRPLDQPLDAFEPGVNHVADELKVIFENTGLPRDEADQRKVFLDIGKQLVAELDRRGITIVAGTDMMVPGYSLYRELELYYEAGLTPAEVLRTATITPARVMKKENHFGSITTGKIADLIIVDGNPLENISSIRKVTMVIKGGVIYDPAELRALVGFRE
jgi:imidazolonepropionase-like amidohydrolase